MCRTSASENRVDTSQVLSQIRKFFGFTGLINHTLSVEDGLEKFVCHFYCLVARVRIICRAIVHDVYWIQYFFVIVKNFLCFDYRCYKVEKQVSIIFLIESLAVFAFFVCRKPIEKIQLHLYLFHLQHIVTRLSFYLSILCTCYVYRR